MPTPWWQTRLRLGKGWTTTLRSPKRHDPATWGNLVSKPGADARSGALQNATLPGVDGQHFESFAPDSRCGAALYGSAGPPAHYSAYDVSGQNYRCHYRQLRTVAKYRVHSKIETASH